MCGIVAYHGRAENPLTRILTGMWSIIYRAPDSTGVGVFGDEVVPLRTRKALGSVQDLVALLNNDPLSVRSGADLAGSLATPGQRRRELIEAQRRLLAYEGLPPHFFREIEQGARPYITWPELSDPVRGKALKPGMTGRPGPGLTFPVHSLKGLRRAIEVLMFRHDLPPLVVKSIVLHSLSATLDTMSLENELSLEPEQVFQEFEFLFERVTEYEKSPGEEEGIDHMERAKNVPRARRLLWRAFLKDGIAVPADYDRDGVCRLFNCLDALVLSRLSDSNGLSETLHATMASFFERDGRKAPAHWHTLYRAERALNVYGLAAAAVYTVLFQAQSALFSPESGVRPYIPSDTENIGKTVPAHLAALGQPILAHGRWALQSQVTIDNTHPFLDQTGLRCACINGQFSSDVERRVRRFLTRVAGIEMRSENSTEYFAQLWGYYARVLSREQKRNEAVRQQVSLGMDDLAAGSHVIDYQVFYALRDLSVEDIEEMAFARAMQVMIQDGGQVAVAGISLLSPHRLFAASHNRPLFIVQRRQGSEVMLVSDVNAALGLFSQREIQISTRRLRRLSAEGEGGSLSSREAILSQFDVMVTPLQGEELLARIDTHHARGGVRYKVKITDFSGREQSDIDPFYTRLSPVQIKRDLNRTFYETHLQEIPDRLRAILESYLPAGEALDLARFRINRRLLVRRFGAGLSSLRRLFIVGMGSSFHAAVMAKSMIRSLVPELPVVALTPVAVDDIARTMDPDRDLVICLSWSGTTADMVQFAKDIDRHHVLGVGVTEKPFSDMALVLQKSGGVIPVYSGEEVTVSAVKSLLSMLLGLEIFCLALLRELGHREKAEFLAPRMMTLPQTISDLLANEDLRAWSRKQSAAYSRSMCHLVLDTRHSVGTGTEIALKLEENSWLSMGKSYDFRDVEEAIFRRWHTDNLILVNATNMVRLQEALACMKRLHRAGIGYALVTFEHEYLGHMQDLGAPEPACLPKVDDVLQPFVDLVFHMQFGLDFGLAHGRKPGEFPRNRAKSVTAGRSRPLEAPSPGREIRALAVKNEKCQSLPEFETLPETIQQVSRWEQEKAVMDWEGGFYKDLRGLCELLLTEDALPQLMDLPEDQVRVLSEFILNHLTVDGEIIFVPLDKAAEATARTVARYWATLLGCFIRVEAPGARLHSAGGDTLIILLAADLPDDFVLENILPDLVQNFLWIGPPLEEYFARIFIRYQAYAPLRPEGLTCGQELLYAALSLFFTRILEARKSEWAAILKQHFRLSGLAVAATLNDAFLWRATADAARADKDYVTALFIGPATGNGAAWVRRFDREGGKLMEWYDFGFAAHGPLVTVDDQVAEKFVSLPQKTEAPQLSPVGPFFAHNRWFLPELKEGYDCGRDNLIIIDASAERAFGQALDELATFGCRFARLTVISQAAFEGQGKLAAFNPHPLSHLLLFPDMGGEAISECLLPFVQALLCAALAARTASH